MKHRPGDAPNNIRRIPAPAPTVVSPELVDRPRRRRTFTAADKLRVLGEGDRAVSGGRGVIHWRERLYSSALTDWRRPGDAGAYDALKVIQR